MKDYPTKDDLKKITEWDFDKDGVEEFFCFIEKLWHWNDIYFRNKMNTMELHTGGWSGNEDIVQALQGNRLFWSLCWKKSERGGHYTFDLKPLRKMTRKK